jgi:hypothetical protein
MSSSSITTQSFPYPVDYNDHFETPLQAYQDLLPILDWLQPDRSKQRIYDPYYCQGRTTQLLQQLGYSKILHYRRDFYADIRHNKVPAHDVLITNPPYSDDHKKKCLDFCLQQLQDFNVPFFLLLPNYVAARDYYRVLENHEDNVAYLIPSKPYQYHHPDGTGHDVAPFESLWFCGLGKKRLKQCQLGLFKSYHELPSTIHTKRPNPRQRRKRKQRQEQNLSTLLMQKEGEYIVPPKTTTPAKTSPERNEGPPKKRSRYRDEATGLRMRKRF